MNECEFNPQKINLTCFSIQLFIRSFKNALIRMNNLKSLIVENYYIGKVNTPAS